MGVLQLLASDNFITYSKVIAKKYGVNVAILLGALCSYQNSFGEGAFYKEQPKISEDTCLSQYEIQQALKVLKNEGIVEVTKHDIPARNYYQVVQVKLSKILTTCDEEFRPLEVQNLDHYNTNNTITKNTLTNNTKKNSKKVLDDEEVKQLFFAFTYEVQGSISKWLQFKKEKNQSYKPTGLKALLKRLQKDAYKNGDDYVIDEIEHSIENNYSGIYAPKQATTSTTKVKESKIYDDEDLSIYYDR